MQGLDIVENHMDKNTQTDMGSGFRPGLVEGLVQRPI